MVLKVFTEESHAESLRIIPYAPFIAADLGSGKDLQGEERGWDAKYLKYWRERAGIIRRCGIEEADVVVAPFDGVWFRGSHWRPNRNRKIAAAIYSHTRKLYEFARSRGIPFVLFFSGDRSHEPVPFEHAYVFRESVYESRRRPRDFCMPGFAEDIAREVPGDVPGERAQDIVLRGKADDRPTVGFCGLAPATEAVDFLTDAVFFAYILLRIGSFEPSPHLGERLRLRALNILQASPAVHSNFIIRSESVFFSSRMDGDFKKKVRAEYIENMLGSDYVLCCRGSGNYSFRLYETMSMGRIPVFIDTDSTFPLQDQLDWTRLCVICSPRDLSRLPEIVAADFAAHTEDSFRQRQLELRRVWKESISPRGFFDKCAGFLGSGLDP